MAYGVEQQIGIGQAQVLPKPADLNDFAQQLNEQKRYSDQQKIYRQREKDRNDKELYGIIGDALNPKNFNALIHDKLRTATNEMAAKLKGSEMSYGDVYMEAHQKAGELGLISDKLNKIDSQLAATRGEYDKFDKGLKTSAIEFEARKRILNQLRSGEPIDENVNYFDEALNTMGSGSLNYEGSTPIDFLPDEVQAASGGYKKRNKVGVTTSMKWNSKIPTVIYDVKDDGNNPPTVTTKGEKSGIKDAEGKEIQMLSEDAYRRWTLLPSKKRELYERVVSQYGNMPMRSPQAEKLMRIEAYKDAENIKPIVNEVPEEIQPTPKTYNNIYMPGAGGGEVKGHLFDKVNLGYYGNPQQGRIDQADKKILPAELQAALKAQGIDISDSGTFKVEIENGKTVAITPNEGNYEGKRIDWEAVANSQKKINTEGMKQAQQNFENKTPQVPQPSVGGNNQKKNDDLSGYDIPQGAKVVYGKDGKPLGYELNGKKFKFQ